MDTPEEVLEISQIKNELFEIEAELKEMEEDFGDIGLAVVDDDQESSSELDGLNKVIEGTDFEFSVAESSATPSILDIADAELSEDEMQEGLWDVVKSVGQAVSGGVQTVAGSIPGSGFIKNLIKKRAWRLISKLIRLVKRYRRLAVCAPKVAAAVAAFKVGRYGTAMKIGYSAYRCIQKRL